MVIRQLRRRAVQQRPASHAVDEISFEKDAEIDSVHALPIGHRVRAAGERDRCSLADNYCMFLLRLLCLAAYKSCGFGTGKCNRISISRESTSGIKETFASPAQRNPEENLRDDPMVGNDEWTSTDDSAHVSSRMVVAKCQGG